MKKFQLILFLCLALLYSCGPKQIAVKYADTYIERQIEKRLPLYDAQEETLARDIDKFLNDHKAAVKVLVPVLEKLNLEDPRSLEEQYQKLTTGYLEIARDFARILVRPMSAFDQKQRKDFLKRMREENNSIFARDRKERREKIESRIKHFLGTLSETQVKILRDHAHVFDEQLVSRSERRSKLHKEFKDILEQDLSPKTKESLLFDAFVKNQKEALASTENLEIAKKFLPTLSVPQKKSLRTHLAELEEIADYFLQTNY